MSRNLLRMAAAITLLFAAGHTIGATHPRTDGALGVVATAMKSVHFEMFGAERTYWDLFEGYGYTMIAVALFLAVLLWLLSARRVADVRPIIFATAVVQLAIAVLAFRYFFWAPGLFNAVSAACAATAAALP